MKILKTAISFLVIVTALTSCATHVRSIKRTPKRYVNKEVIIRGKITEIHAVSPPLLKILEIDDRKDKIYVLTVKQIKTNRKKTFKGEILPVKRPISKLEVFYIRGKVSKYLIDYNLATPGDSIKISKKILELIRSSTPEDKITILMLDKKIKCYLFFNAEI